MIKRQMIEECFYETESELQDEALLRMDVMYPDFPNISLLAVFFLVTRTFQGSTRESDCFFEVNMEIQRSFTTLQDFELIIRGEDNEGTTRRAKETLKIKDGGTKKFDSILALISFLDRQYDEANKQPQPPIYLSLNGSIPTGEYFEETKKRRVNHEKRIKDLLD